MNLVETAAAIRSRDRAPLDLARRALERIEERRELNAIAHVDAAQVLRNAGALDAEARAGSFRGPLHGVPITIKDLFNVAGSPTRCGARATMPPIEPAEAVAVARLRAAGALLLAKTNMVEIALGTTGENPWTGDVLNPHDTSRMSGGSSSGSAVAVAAGICLGSLGTDTAGSIRVPAAWCGIAGFKPTFGRVSLEGALPLCPSCDHAGPLARSVGDCALLFGVIASEKDAPAGGRAPVMAPRLGVPRRYLEGALAPDVRRAFDALLLASREAGATIVDVEPEHVDAAAAAFVPLRAESAHVHRAALRDEPASFSPFVRAELERGRGLSAVDYLEGLRLQGLVREGMAACLATVDAMLMPSVPVPAPPRGSTETTLESGVVPLRQAVLHLSRPFALAGVPAVSVPIGGGGVLPIGVQVACAAGEDRRALAIAAWIEERATGL